ncbi:hypothetical protein ACAG96_03515 [Candidatus Izemoplasma sp. B36]|uniref:hypothetical protein n=1 Tax=Candidatus Izemoplasma sp. B36 TaxID=3242468 RepID=UPI0035566D0B
MDNLKVYSDKIIYNEEEYLKLEGKLILKIFENMIENKLSVEYEDGIEHGYVKLFKSLEEASNEELFLQTLLENDSNEKPESVSEEDKNL